VVDTLCHDEQLFAIPRRFWVRVQKRVNRFDIGEFDEDGSLGATESTVTSTSGRQVVYLELFRFRASHPHRVSLTILFKEFFQFLLEIRFLFPKSFLKPRIKNIRGG
jgi:hypothetical protein